MVAAVPVIDAVAAHAQDAWIVDHGARRNCPRVDRAGQRYHLHHRSRFVDVAHDVVLEQRRVGVVEIVCVVARVIGPRDDAAGRRVHDQHAAAFSVVPLHAVSERLLSGVLDVGVECRHEVQPVGGILVSVCTEHDLPVREVAVARDVSRCAGKRLLVFALEAVVSVSVPVDETKQVGGERGSPRNPGQIRALRLLLETDTRKLERPQLVRLGLRHAARDVGELRARSQRLHHLRPVDAERRGQCGRDAVAVIGLDLVRRDEGRIDGRVDDELGQVAVEDRAAHRRQLDDLVVLGLGLGGELDMAKHLPVSKPRPHSAAEQSRDQEQGQDAQPRAHDVLNSRGPFGESPCHLVAGRHYVAGAADLVEDRAQVALPQGRAVAARCAGRRLEVDRDRLRGNVRGRRSALHPTLRGLLLDLGRRVERHLLVTQLVLLGDELALLVLQAGDVI